jgi:hypothetical protein
MLSYLKIGYTKQKEIARWRFSPYSGVTNLATTRFLVLGTIGECNFNRICILATLERFEKPFGDCDEIGVSKICD